MTRPCMHCEEPPCAEVCPTGATYARGDGLVVIDYDKCIGCRYCVVACPFGIPKYQYDDPFGRIGKCELCRHRHKDGHYSACAEVCPTGATLFGRTEDLLAEAKRRLALKPGSVAKFPRGRLRPATEKMLQGQADGKGEKRRHGWRDEPDQIYEATVGKYVQHVYGEKEYGGTQVLKLSAVPFEKLGMRQLPERSFASVSETMQHTLYGYLIAPAVVLGGLVLVAKRNMREEDEASKQER